MIEIATVWAPRMKHEKWGTADYFMLMELQRDVIKAAGHHHVVVTDDPAAERRGFNLMRAQMQPSLMRALIEGQIIYLRQWTEQRHLLLADIDVLVAPEIEQAFDGTFDIGLTSRKLPGQEIQNGVMYFHRGSKRAALELMEKTLELCGEAWGTDQAALSKAAGPIPDDHCIVERYGVRFAFLPCETHNFTAKHSVPKQAGHYAYHFKGRTKMFAKGMAARMLGR